MKHNLNEIEHIKGESWKVIENACADIRSKNKKYYISNKGRVFSEYKGLMTISTNEKGYKYVRMKILLNGDYIYKQQFIHRLVAFYFCDGYKKGLVVNHKDENPSNNNSENLEWVTQKYNLNYGSVKIKSQKTKEKNRELEKYRYLILGILMGYNQRVKLL